MGQETKLHPASTPIDLYVTILRSISDPFNILDREFRIIWANEARAKIHLRTLKEMIGKFCYEMFQRRNQPCPECPVKVAFNSGKACVMKRWVDLPDGSRRWGEIRAYPVFDKRGNIVYAIEIGVDITEREHSMQRQREYIKSLEKTLEAMTKKKIEAILEYEKEKGQISLTKREIEVLSFMGKGFSNVRISKILRISPSQKYLKFQLVNPSTLSWGGKVSS